MAARYLTTRRREGAVATVTLLCTGGVFVGVAALVLALALMAGVQADLQQRLLACNPHVILRAGGGGAQVLQSDEVESLIRQVLSHPGVAAASPFSLEETLMFSRIAPTGIHARLTGIDPKREAAVTGLEPWTSPGAWALMSRSPEPVAESSAPVDDELPLSTAELAPPEAPPIILGVGLSLELGVVPGEIVNIMSATPQLSALGLVPRSRAYRVVGLLKTGLQEYDESWALTRLEPPRPGGSHVQGIEIAVRDPLQSRRIADELEARLPGDLIATDWTRTFARLFAAFRFEKRVMVLFVGLIGVVAGFNIFTILTLNVMARTADIGVMAALGARPASIARIFAWMGLGLGGLGSALGLAAGSLIAWMLDHWQLVELDPAVYLVSHVSFRVLPGDLLLVGLGMLGMSLLATALPARTAARLDPVVALRKA